MSIERKYQKSRSGKLVVCSCTLIVLCSHHTSFADGCANIQRVVASVGIHRRFKGWQRNLPQVVAVLQDHVATNCRVDVCFILVRLRKLCLSCKSPDRDLSLNIIGS